MRGPGTASPVRYAAVAGELLAIATTAAHAAGELLVERFRAPRTGVGTKSSSTDMVTDADRASEERILNEILRVRPDDAVLGEETGEARGSSGLRWIVDPLDGTTNFVYGIPQWAVSVACEDEHGPLVGVVHDPVRGETFSAARGAGATRDGNPIRVGGLDDLSRALLATGYGYLADERVAAAAMLPAILGRVRDVRRAGAASLDLAWTACGRVDGYFEVPIAHWDVAAGVLLVAEAGGQVASLEPLGRSGSGMVAAGPGIFEDLRALVEAALAGSRRARGAG